MLANPSQTKVDHSQQGQHMQKIPLVTEGPLFMVLPFLTYKIKRRVAFSGAGRKNMLGSLVV